MINLPAETRFKAFQLNNNNNIGKDIGLYVDTNSYAINNKSLVDEKIELALESTHGELNNRKANMHQTDNSSNISIHRVQSETNIDRCELNGGIGRLNLKGENHESAYLLNNLASWNTNETIYYQPPEQIKTEYNNSFINSQSSIAFYDNYNQIKSTGTNSNELNSNDSYSNEYNSYANEFNYENVSYYNLNEHQENISYQQQQCAQKSSLSSSNLHYHNQINNNSQQNNPQQLLHIQNEIINSSHYMSIPASFEIIPNRESATFNNFYASCKSNDTKEPLNYSENAFNVSKLNNIKEVDLNLIELPNCYKVNLHSNYDKSYANLVDSLKEKPDGKKLNKKLMAYEKRILKQREKDAKKILKDLIKTNRATANSNVTNLNETSAKRGRKPKQEKYNSNLKEKEQQAILTTATTTTTTNFDASMLDQSNSNCSLTNDLEEFAKYNHFTFSKLSLKLEGCT
jgi:hypothetical protein